MLRLVNFAKRIVNWHVYMPENICQGTGLSLEQVCCHMYEESLRFKAWSKEIFCQSDKYDDHSVLWQNKSWTGQQSYHKRQAQLKICHMYINPTR